MTDAGENLPGNVGGATRHGDRVYRPTGPWTLAVHALLRYLTPRLAHIPAVHGFDDAGREVVDFLPGHVIDHDRECLSDAQLVSLVTWTAQFHGAVAGFVHPGPWRYFPVAGATLIGHNDLAPYNVCFDGDELSGVFDWDLAGPSTPLAELAFVAWNSAPLTRDLGTVETARRLRLIAAAYSSRGSAVDARELLQAVPGRVQLMLDGIPAAAASGDAGMANLVALGEPERSQVVLDALVSRLPLVYRLLDRP